MPDIKHSIQTAAAPQPLCILFVASAKGFSRWWGRRRNGGPGQRHAGASVFSTARPSTAFTPSRWQRRARPTVTANLARSGSARGCFSIWRNKKARRHCLIAHADWQAETDYFRGLQHDLGELMFRLVPSG